MDKSPIGNRQFENGQLKNRRLENNIWKTKNIQHGLVRRGCSASGWVQDSFQK